MAGTFQPTRSYSNLTPAELEQLRKGFYSTANKAVTVGDSGLALQEVFSGTTGTTDGTRYITDTNATFPGTVSPGDTLTIAEGAAEGQYTVISVMTNSLYLDRNLNTAAEINYKVWTPTTSVGIGSVTAEPFVSSPMLFPNMLVPWTPGAPGTYLGTLLQTSDIPSEVARWYGPSHVFDGTAGFADDVNLWTDYTPGLNFTLSVQAGDLLLIRPTTLAQNNNAVCRVSSVAANTLTLDRVATSNTTQDELYDEGYVYHSYIIIRPSAIKLFAIPGSGPLGREQTFAFMPPGSTLHTMVSPTAAQIDAQRLRKIVPPLCNSATVDRADAPYLVSTSYAGPDLLGLVLLDKLGYRVVLYPDNGAGSPDLSKPIAKLNPVIDPALPMADQQMTIDFGGGFVRFSVAPATGGDIKPSSGCVDGTTGRLNLYAVFWAYDETYSYGSVESLWKTRATESAPQMGASISFTGADAWVIGASGQDHDFYVQALPFSEDPTGRTYFGAQQSAYNKVYFVYDPNGYRASGSWLMKPNKTVAVNPKDSNEVEVGQKLALTVGDISHPMKSPADWTPATNAPGRGRRDPTPSIQSALQEIIGGSSNHGGYGVLHLRRGTFYTNQTITVPPGVIIEGEGGNTIVRAVLPTEFSTPVTTPAFRFGPNTSWGVYDPTWNPADSTVTATKYALTSAHRIEGMEVIWNPVRRVWATFVADVTTNAVWFNEVRQDGTTRFNGLGVNIKTSTELLFTSTSTNSQFHTPGHYPRAAYHEHFNEYTVVWVDDKGGASPGPSVKVQTFEVTDYDAIVYQYTSNLPVTLSGLYTTHPSVAVRNTDTSYYYQIVVNCWYYNNATTPTSSEMRTYYFTRNPSPSLSYYTTSNITGAKNIFSSTDIAEDGLGGYMLAYSVREHALIVGPIGATCGITESGGTYLTDAGVTNWVNEYGISTSSRVLLLGEPAPTSAPYWTFDQEAYLRPSATAGLVTGFGTDCIVYNTTINALRLYLKDPATGTPPYSSSYWRITNSTTGSATGTTTFTDTNATFINSGVKAGDILRSSYGGDNYATPYTVVSVDSQTQLTLGSNFPNTSGPNATYKIWVGMVHNTNRHFTYAIAPACWAFTKRWFSGDVPGTQYDVSRTTVSTSWYNVVPTEAEYVRLERGSVGANWLLAYQTFNTTALMARYRMLNFNEGFNTSFKDYQGLVVQDTQAPYREHISTCAVLLSDIGYPVSPAQQMQSASVTSDRLEAAISRNIGYSSQSLGAREPLTRRPNYVNANVNTSIPSWPYYNDSYNRRRAQDLNKEVSASCFMDRCTLGKVPSRIPDLTWSGTDWTVVSPSKAHFHFYTGTYMVDGGFNVTLFEPTFYFGYDNTTVDNNYLRHTVTPYADKVYFPSNGTIGTITAVYSEHGVTLAQQDSLLLAKGALTTTTNIEWVLLRGSNSFTNAGIKNPGFRVSADGRVIVGSSYVTFADDPGDNPDFLPRQELMRRSQPDDFLRMWGNNTGANLPGMAAGIEYNEPGEDGIEEASRYVADIGFKGVAVGEPKGCSHQNLFESPMVAISWGENMFGAIDHVVSQYLGTDSNEIRVYRQSFGPYNNGIRNLKIETGHVTGWSQEWQVLSRQHVLTRHGLPASATGFFATDGFRNCFAYPKARTFSGNISYSSNASENGEPEYALFARYTDAVGRNPVELEGPRPNMQTSDQARMPLPYANEVYSSTNVGVYPSWPSAPRVVWDGSRFVTAWVEGGIIFNDSGITQTVLCLAALPGSEDQGLQGPELVAPSDHLTVMRATQRARLNVQMDLTSLQPQFATLDIAFSGRTYAVLWAAGLDQTTGLQGAVVGVTLFDAAGFNGVGAATAVPYFTNTTGATSANSSIFSDAGASFQAGLGVRVGDVIHINSNNNLDGLYTILAITSNTSLVLDRMMPSTVSNLSYAIHRSLGVGARTYTLDVPVAGWTLTGGDRDVFVSPKILWDGKQFVAIWRERAWMFSTTSARGVACVAIPEQGIEKGLSVKTFAGGGQGFLADDASAATNIGVLSTGTATPEWIYYSTATIPRRNIRVQPGDIFICTGSTYDGTGHPNNAGWYEITEVDYINNRFRCKGRTFDSTMGITNAYMFGAILGGGASESSYNLSANTSTNSAIPTGELGAAPALVYPALDSPIQHTKVEKILGFVYNEKDDEYAVLFVNVNAGTYYLSLGAFNRQTMRFRAINDLRSSTTPMRCGSLAWNGRSYLVTYALDGATSQDVGFYVCNSALTPEANDTLATYTSIIGNSTGLIPGPLYGTYNSSAAVKAKVRNIQSVWNPRLNRFAIAVSYFWHDESLRSGSPTTKMLADGYFTGVTASSWGTNGTMGMSGVVTGYQPGIKVAFFRNTLSTFAWIEGYTTIMTLAGSTLYTDSRPLPSWADTDTTERFTPLNAAPYLSGGFGAASTWGLPREDVFVFTLGFDSPSVQFLDADNCSLENVVLSGALDIEERYVNMASPMWQVSGKPFGCPTVASSGTHFSKLSAVHRGPQYNHLLKTPAGKVELPKLINVKSSAKIRYGYGTPTTAPDRASLMDRSWRK